MGCAAPVFPHAWLVGWKEQERGELSSTRKSYNKCINSNNHGYVMEVEVFTAPFGLSPGFSRRRIIGVLGRTRICREVLGETIIAEFRLTLYSRNTMGVHLLVEAAFNGRKLEILPSTVIWVRDHLVSVKYFSCSNRLIWVTFILRKGSNCILGGWWWLLCTDVSV